MSSNNNNRGCTIFPAHFFGSVKVFCSISTICGSDKDNLLLQCCYKVSKAVGVQIKRPDQLNSSVNMDNYICDEVQDNLDHVHDLVNFSISEQTISVVHSKTLVKILNHPLVSVSSISSCVSADLGFVCYIFKNPISNERAAFVFGIPTVGLEHQIVRLATDMFCQLSNSTCGSSYLNSTSLRDISFISADHNYSGLARLERLHESDTQSFQKLNFLRPSANPSNSPYAGSNTRPYAGSNTSSIGQHSRDLSFRINRQFKMRATDGTEYVPNNMLHFERWYHGTNILYSKDCLREPGDFYVYKFGIYFVLRINNSFHNIEDIVLQNESNGENAIMTDQDTVYHSVSHFINFHIRRDTKFVQKDGGHFTLQNPILRVINDQWFSSR